MSFSLLPKNIGCNVDNCILSKFSWFPIYCNKSLIASVVENVILIKVSATSGLIWKDPCVGLESGSIACHLFPV